MEETLTANVPWSAEVVAQAERRIRQAESWAGRHSAAATLPVVIGVTAYAAVMWGREAGCVLLLGVLATALLVGVIAHGRAGAARRRRMAAAGLAEEWSFDANGIVYRSYPDAGPLRLQWRWARVTRFSDGFVLAFPATWTRYWVPATALPGPAADGFEALARAAAASYRVTGG